jgi:hypothetical protein
MLMAPKCHGSPRGRSLNFVTGHSGLTCPNMPVTNDQEKAFRRTIQGAARWHHTLAATDGVPARTGIHVATSSPASIETR